MARQHLAELYLKGLHDLAVALEQSGDLKRAEEYARRAVAAYNYAAKWKRLQSNGMKRDFGWTRAAHEYAEIYRRITATS